MTFTGNQDASYSHTMTVTEIRTIDSKKSVVYLDGEKAFRLYKGELKKLHLSEGSVLSKDDYEAVLKDIICPRCLKRSFYLLSKQDYTEYKLREKLMLSDYPDEVVDYTIDRLRSQGYINDLGYARNYIEFRMESEGVKSLTAKLIAKGISRDIVEQAIYELETDGIDFSESQRAALDKSLKKKLARTKGDLSAPEVKSKVIAYLVGKGYSYSDIQSALDNYE